MMEYRDKSWWLPIQECQIEFKDYGIIKAKLNDNELSLEISNKSERIGGIILLSIDDSIKGFFHIGLEGSGKTIQNYLNSTSDSTPISFRANLKNYMQSTNSSMLEIKVNLYDKEAFWSLYNSNEDIAKRLMIKIGEYTGNEGLWISNTKKFSNKKLQDHKPNSNNDDKQEFRNAESSSQSRLIKDCRDMLENSKNIILRGAPGTGKTYLAKQIAADIVSNGVYTDYNNLSPEQQKQIEFVQFHPSYDYSDFVEGLRPAKNDNNSMGFKLEDGIFKKFVNRAKKNYEDSQKSHAERAKEISVQNAITDFFDTLNFNNNEFKTVNGSKFTISNVDDKNIYISILEQFDTTELSVSLNDIRKMLESGFEFNKVKDVTDFFGKKNATRQFSYIFSIYNVIRENMKKTPNGTSKKEELKKYVFIIDEINRGEISKIFGELFFAIDPGYRGKAGEISTQYSNMHDDPDEKFYIPENVYIIGTMNDIDRSVDSFDFAMRRRFRFVEVKAKDQAHMLDCLNDAEDAKACMKALNDKISEVVELNDNYHIGPSYFLKLKDHHTFDDLWKHYIEPLLQEYVRGMNEKGLMEKFEDAYNSYKKHDESSSGNDNNAVGTSGNIDESAQN